MTARTNPYVGLGPFGEDDHEWFFGREREIALITANLKASRLTLLYGASGVGKSSVLLAGVLPHLHALVAGNRAMASRPSSAARSRSTSARRSRSRSCATGGTRRCSRSSGPSMRP